MTAILARADIQKLLKQKPPLIEEYFNLKEQLQPNGIDLTLREIALPQASGRNPPPITTTSPVSRRN